MSFSGYGVHDDSIAPEKIELVESRVEVEQQAEVLQGKIEGTIEGTIEGGDVSSEMRQYLDKIKAQVMQKEQESNVVLPKEVEPKPKSFLSSFSFMSSTMFDKCAKAPWQPPNSVFPIVWSFLYTVYFVLLAKTWKSKSSRNSLLIGLALNIAWIPAFAYNAKAGLAILAIMIGVAFDTSRRLELDGYHTLNNWFQPYLIWLIFAFTLNMYIVANCP
jgi:tryptophan-rich sensory protein